MVEGWLTGGKLQLGEIQFDILLLEWIKRVVMCFDVLKQ